MNDVVDTRGGGGNEVADTRAAGGNDVVGTGAGGGAEQLRIWTVSSSGSCSGRPAMAALAQNLSLRMSAPLFQAVLLC